jgi:hypothetical protein
MVQAGRPVGAIILSKSKIAGPPEVSCTVSKAVIGVVTMSLIVPPPVLLKIESPPDTTNGVAVPEHAGAIPEKAIQGVLLDTDNSAVLLFLIKSPVPVIGIAVANTFGVITITASPSEAKPATLRPTCEFLNLLIFCFFLLRLSVHSGLLPGSSMPLPLRLV